jgi:hypothetical protein
MDTEPEDQAQPMPQGTDPSLDEAMKTLEKDPQKMIDDIGGKKDEEGK